MPLMMIAITRPPRIASTTRPLPPKRLVPPMTAAPTAYSRVEAPPVDGEIELSRLAIMMPPTAASVEPMMKQVHLMPGTLMPARRAASALPPTA